MSAVDAFFLMQPPIKQAIVQQSDEQTRCCLRKVDRGFRSLVDSSTVRYELMLLDLNDTEIKMKWNVFKKKPSTVAYRAHSDGCLVKHGDVEKLVRGADYLQLALQDFGSLVLKPRLTIDTFYIEPRLTGTVIIDRFLDALRATLRALEHQLHVTSLHIGVSTNEQQILAVLPYMKPKVLSSTDFTSDCLPRTVLPMEEVVRTEQFRSLKSHASGGFVSRVALRDLPTLNSLKIALSEVSPQEVLALKNAALVNPSFANAIIDCENFDFRAVLDTLDRPENDGHGENVVFESGNGEKVFGRVYRDSIVLRKDP